MRIQVAVPAFLFATFGLAVSPALADPLITFTLDSNIGYAYSTSLTPDPAPGCPGPYCALFSGTLTDLGDTDTDVIGVYYSFATVSFPYTSDPSAFSGLLSLDFTTPPGLISGDTNWATDGLGNPSNTYTGPIFGVDLPPNTPVGLYTGTVSIDFMDLDTSHTTTVYQAVSVDVVAPEPSAAGLLLAVLLPFAIWHGVRCKSRSSEASR